MDYQENKKNEREQQIFHFFQEINEKGYLNKESKKENKDEKNMKEFKKLEILKETNKKEINETEKIIKIKELLKIYFEEKNYNFLEDLLIVLIPLLEANGGEELKYFLIFFGLILCYNEKKTQSLMMFEEVLKKEGFENDKILLTSIYYFITEIYEVNKNIKSGEGIY
jgi:hypothetical protein